MGGGHGTPEGARPWTARVGGSSSLPAGRWKLAWFAAAGLALASCDGGGTASPTRIADVAAWRGSPEVLSVQQNAAGWRISGRAAPQTRVAFRAGEQVFATSTDAAGEFSLVIPAAPAPRALAIETREGQSVARAIPTLLVPAVGETAPAILGAPGGRSFVFGARRLVEAIDTDGAIWLVSGTVEPGAEVTLNAAGGLSLTVRADAAGAWQAQVPAEPSLAVRSGERSTVVSPRFAEPPDSVMIAYLGSPQGVSFAWRLPDGAVQRTWTPAG